MIIAVTGDEILSGVGSRPVLGCLNESLSSQGKSRASGRK